MSYVMRGEDIRRLRAILKLTSEQLGELLGVTGNTVRRWECGARQAKGPAAAMLRRMTQDIQRQVIPA